VATEVHTLNGITLSRVETGESHMRLSVFSPSQGLQLALLRKSRGKSAVPPPDLFDQVELHLQIRQSSGLPFIKEHRVLQKRRGLAMQHDRFQSASDLALLYLDNGRHLLEPKPSARLLEKALASLCEGGNPQVVFFKTLFVFAKNEGHPVRESWLPALPALERASALAILGKPVEEQKNPPPALNSLLESLRVWLNSETELRC